MRFPKRTAKVLPGRLANGGLAVLLALASQVPVSAQYNGLLKSSRHPAPAYRNAVPTTQPILRAATAGPGPMQVRGSLAVEPYAESPNPVLLRMSPIAVAVPEPERIEVNDLITIIVRETKSSAIKTKLQSDKEWKLEAELKKWFRLDEGNHLVPQGFRGGIPGADFEFKSEYEGVGKVDRRDTLTMRITAKVIDVKPNGTLMLEAKKQVGIDEEQYITTLTGQCRSEDLTAQNTVLSTQIHDLKIDVQHTGAARDAARRGWLMRLFDFLRPL